ncbi:MAG: hypothetical protein JST42_07815 [Bacteroidetes bacterium]|nr:hypothetical protein [Bacteroidota bacterium]
MRFVTILITVILSTIHCTAQPSPTQSHSPSLALSQSHSHSSAPSHSSDSPTPTVSTRSPVPSTSTQSPAPSVTTQLPVPPVTTRPPSSSPDSSVELRFQLIEQKNSDHLALDVQIINHSAKDIYLPSINFFTIHLYALSDSGWDELRQFAHTAYPRTNDNPALHAGAMDIRFLGNPITNRYMNKMDESYRSRRKLVDSFYRQNPPTTNQGKFFSEMLNTAPPYFIRAGEAQSHALMIALDDLWLKPATTYRISYGTGSFDEKNIAGGKQRLMDLPAIFNGYTRWLGNMWSNTLYYSTVDF